MHQNNILNKDKIGLLSLGFDWEKSRIQIWELSNLNYKVVMDTDIYY